MCIILLHEQLSLYKHRILIFMLYLFILDEGEDYYAAGEYYCTACGGFSGIV